MFPRTCTCCGATYTREQWDALPAKPLWRIEGLVLEQRDCPCTNTMAMEIKESK